jgi:hypothetical protein
MLLKKFCCSRRRLNLRQILVDAQVWRNNARAGRECMAAVTFGQEMFASGLAVVS